MQYEYLIVDEETAELKDCQSTEQVQEYLNLLGLEEWELITASVGVLMFKRELARPLPKQLRADPEDRI